VEQPLSEWLWQTVNIANNAGASGMVGAEPVANSLTNGLVVLVGNMASLAINVGIYAEMPCDPSRDFTSIVRTEFCFTFSKSCAKFLTFLLNRGTLSLCRPGRWECFLLLIAESAKECLRTMDRPS